MAYASWELDGYDQHQLLGSTVDIKRHLVVERGLGAECMADNFNVLVYDFAMRVIITRSNEDVTDLFRCYANMCIRQYIRLKTSGFHQ